MDKLCRLCANTSSVLHPIFTNNTATDTVEKIQICSSVQISADDGLPTTICLPCYDKLTAAHSFRLQILSAQVKLRHLHSKAELTDWKILEPLCDIKTENTSNENINYTDTKTNVEKTSTILEPLCDIKTDDNSDSESKKSYDVFTAENYVNSDEESNSEEEKRMMSQTKKKRRTRRTAAGPNASTVCPFCGMILKQSSFSDHISNVHKEEASVECEECGKMLKNKRQLWHHKRKHQDNKVNCDKCGKTYKTKDGFRVHYRDVHLGIRNHSCTICNKSFPRTIALKRHMRSHTGEKPYVCPYCGRGFSGNWNLKQHIRLHTKEKPYRCQICNEGFTQNVMLKVHMRNKHK